KYGRRGIRVGDLRQLACLRPVLAERVERAHRLLELMGSPDRASLDAEIALPERWAPRLLPFVVDTGLLVHRAIKAAKRGLRVAWAEPAFAISAAISARSPADPFAAAGSAPPWCAMRCG